MFAITLREFKSLFQSIRAILIIVVLFGVSIGSAKLVSQFKEQLSDLGLGDNAYIIGLMLLLFLASPLFVTSISHSSVNKEIESKTIRFLATKTSRENIIFGKFLGNVSFWVLCLTVALLLIVPFSKSFSIVDLIQSIIFVSYFIGLSLFLSTVVNSSAMTMFVGIFISIALPVIGMWSLISKNVIVDTLSYLTPYYYYTQENTAYTYLVLIHIAVFVIASLMIFKRRDL
ncbi:ABC transporter permease [Exiguobacterium sp. MH3]|uniref:ABC transporter permease n=1 Tax=Exiguobacterium sp. MH3 TaxID=1399115 RepID=UPI0003C402C3|nr:ABC transporter permease subunit [Exiguobacterium sp. MH3]AHA29694.1 membrane protein [Exiguobacterium sp. MH3]